MAKPHRMALVTGVCLAVAILPDLFDWAFWALLVMIWMMAGVLALLVTASVAGFVMARHVGPSGNAVVENFNARTKSWWLMVGIFGITFYFGQWTTVTLFCLLSFLALREFITLNFTG